MMANEKITKALVQRPLSKISQLLQEFALMAKCLAPAKHSDVYCRNTDLVSPLPEGIKALEQTHHFSNCFSDKEKLFNMVEQVLMRFTVFMKLHRTFLNVFMNKHAMLSHSMKRDTR